MADLILNLISLKSKADSAGVSTTATSDTPSLCPQKDAVTSYLSRVTISGTYADNLLVKDADVTANPTSRAITVYKDASIGTTSTTGDIPADGSVGQRAYATVSYKYGTQTVYSDGTVSGPSSWTSGSSTAYGSYIYGDNLGTTAKARTYKGTSVPIKTFTYYLQDDGSISSKTISGSTASIYLEANTYSTSAQYLSLTFGTSSNPDGDIPASGGSCRAQATASYQYRSKYTWTSQQATYSDWVSTSQTAYGNEVSGDNLGSTATSRTKKGTSTPYLTLNPYVYTSGTVASYTGYGNGVDIYQLANSYSTSMQDKKISVSASSNPSGDIPAAGGSRRALATLTYQERKVYSWTSGCDPTYGSWSSDKTITIYGDYVSANNLKDTVTTERIEVGTSTPSYYLRGSESTYYGSTLTIYQAINSLQNSNYSPYGYTTLCIKMPPPPQSANLITNGEDFYCLTSTTGTNRILQPLQVTSIPASTIMANKGKTLCFSFIIYRPDAGTTGSSSWGGTRYGMHWSITIDGTIYYPMAILTTYGSNILVSATWTIPSSFSSCNDLTLEQLYGTSYYAKPSSGTWFITNVKLEFGYSPTRSGIYANGGTQNISGSSYHYAYNYYTSTYVSENAHKVDDTTTLSVNSVTGVALTAGLSYSVLSMRGMGVTTATRNITVTATNNSNTDTTDTQSFSIENKGTYSEPTGYSCADISIAASGGTKSLSAVAGKYTVTYTSNAVVEYSNTRYYQKSIFSGTRYTSSNKLTHSSSAADGYKVLDIYAQVTAGTTYQCFFKFDGTLAPGHNTNYQNQFTVWFYVNTTYNASNTGYDKAVYFTSNNITSLGDNMYVFEYTIPSGYSMIRIRTNSYSNGSTTRTAHFWDFALVSKTGYSTTASSFTYSASSAASRTCNDIAVVRFGSTNTGYKYVTPCVWQEANAISYKVVWVTLPTWSEVSAKGGTSTINNSWSCKIVKVQGSTETDLVTITKDNYSSYGSLTYVPSGVTVSSGSVSIASAGTEYYTYSKNKGSCALTFTATNYGQCSATSNYGIIYLSKNVITTFTVAITGALTYFTGTTSSLSNLSAGEVKQTTSACQAGSIAAITLVYSSSSTKDVSSSSLSTYGSTTSVTYSWISGDGGKIEGSTTGQLATCVVNSRGIIESSSTRTVKFTRTTICKFLLNSSYNNGCSGEKEGSGSSYVLITQKANTKTTTYGPITTVLLYPIAPALASFNFGPAKAEADRPIYYTFTSGDVLDSGETVGNEAFTVSFTGTFYNRASAADDFATTGNIKTVRFLQSAPALDDDLSEVSQRQIAYITATFTHTATGFSASASTNVYQTSSQNTSIDPVDDNTYVLTIKFTNPTYTGYNGVLLNKTYIMSRVSALDSRPSGVPMCLASPSNITKYKGSTGLKLYSPSAGGIANFTSGTGYILVWNNNTEILQNGGTFSIGTNATIIVTL